jgi:hypothetical protein
MTTELVWQMPLLHKVVVVVAHALLLAALIVILVVAPSTGLAITVAVLAGILVWNALAIRRRCVLDDKQLRLQGRFTRRTVELEDLRQVALTPSRFAWVQTDDPPTSIRLGMIPAKRLRTQRKHQIASEAVPIIRQRAEAAGATLEPMPAKGTLPPLGGR